MFKFNIHNYEELILSAGGIRGCYHIGVLEEINKIFKINKFKYYTGCSIGSLLCSLIVIGYSFKEIKDIAINFVWDKFIDLKMMNFIEKKGFDDGFRLNLLIKAFFIQKNIPINITFKELYEKTNKILTITTMNISTEKVEYHNMINTPNMHVILSLRMSLNIPLIFAPIIYNNNLYIDGATIDPYPYYGINIDKSKKLGIFLLEDHMFEKEMNIIPPKEFDLFSYIFRIIQIVWKKQVTRNLKNKIPLNTIRLLDNKTKGHELSLNKDTKIKMYEYGKIIGKKYFTKKNILQKKKLLLFKYFNLWKK